MVEQRIQVIEEVPYGASGSGNGMPEHPIQYGPSGKRKKKSHWGLWLILLLIVAIVLGSFIAGTRPGGGKKVGNTVYLSDGDRVVIGKPYVAILNINGEISGKDATSSVGYRHNFLMNLVKQLEKDENNRGILLLMDTPGGAVYQTDELYLQLMQYKEKTGRPIYTYMGNMAASGGYYLAMSSDKIYANRNCWTGSIGVTMGSIYDVTGFMEKYGIKAVAIHSGRNKAMGSITEELTEEQQQILQSLCNESYDRFVDIVASGRKLPRERVLELADGRLYTASQAKANGMIDVIGTLEQTEQDMLKENPKMVKSGDTAISFVEICHKETASRGFGSLFDLLSGKSSVDNTEFAMLEKVLQMSEKVEVSYIAPIQK